jgi:hypothetical protein
MISDLSSIVVKAENGLYCFAGSSWLAELDRLVYTEKKEAT